MDLLAQTQYTLPSTDQWSPAVRGHDEGSHSQVRLKFGMQSADAQGFSRMDRPTTRSISQLYGHHQSQFSHRRQMALQSECTRNRKGLMTFDGLRTPTTSTSLSLDHIQAVGSLHACHVQDLHVLSVSS
jgi:hypothetical protein